MSGTQKLGKFELPEGADADADAPAPDSDSRRGRALDREPEIEQLRTRLARKFTTLADEVTTSFAEFQIGAGAWRPELMGPTGMSTSGGKQATQNLRLRPLRQGYPVLVGGIVDPVEKTADLRDYEHMLALHHARFGANNAFGITYDEWEQFLRKAEVLLRAEAMVVTRIAAPRELRLLASRGPGVSWRTLAIVTLAIVVPLALLVAWRVAAVLLR